MPPQNQAIQEFPTFACCQLPVVGALVDFFRSSAQYVAQRKMSEEQMHTCKTKSTLTAGYLARFCFLLGLTCNLKLEVITADNRLIQDDLHFVLMSKNKNLYIDDINTSAVLLCLEMSDFILMVTSCILIWMSNIMKHNYKQYMFLPWFGAALRGLFLRQIPTAVALLFTVHAADGFISPLFVVTCMCLFLLEIYFYMEVVVIIYNRWKIREMSKVTQYYQKEVKTLFSKDQSVEMNNYVY